MAGEWVGQYGAYTPWEGMPEPVWLDDNNKYLDWVFTRAVEHAGGEGDGPSGAEAQEQQQQQQRLVRKIGRGTSLEAVSQLAIPLEGSSAGSDEIDVEALSYNSEGVVMFDGGSYSAGPDFIGPPAFKMLRDEDGEEEGAPEAEGGNGSGGMAAQSGEAEEQELDEAPNTISIMEQCLVHRGSRTRVRVKATVSIGHADNGEVELSVMRLVLFKEVWAGPVGALALEAPREVLGPSPCTRLPRPTETQACGEWRCTTTSAVSTEGGEQQAEGQQQAEGHWQAEGQLQTEAAVAAASAHGSGDAAKDGVPPLEWSYSVSEDVQLWELPGRDGPEEGADGGMLWLPGGVLVSFRMFAVEEEEEEAEESEEGGERGSSDSVPGTSSRPGLSNGSSDGEDEGPPPRGFCLGLTWLHDAGQALAMERYYDEEGCLRDVRCTVAAQQQQREWRGQGGG